MTTSCTPHSCHRTYDIPLDLGSLWNQGNTPEVKVNDDNVMIFGKLVVTLHAFSTNLALAVNIAFFGLRDIHHHLIILVLIFIILSYFCFSCLHLKIQVEKRVLYINEWLQSELTSKPEARFRARERQIVAMKVFMAYLSKKIWFLWDLYELFYMICLFYNYCLLYFPS